MSDNTIHFLETHRRTMHHTTAALTVYRHEHTFKHTHTHVLSASASYISCPASVGCSCQEPPIQEQRMRDDANFMMPGISCKREIAG
mmetsp:Transcript_20086/g.32173  ORF Transcript_20086/g.32173 Transcript_20086/m.32173 type:complete len:87 (+) Transcript_20086:241-501(+)